MKTKPISSLDKLMSGAVSERFNDELQKVLENVLDPNTDSRKKRKVTLNVTITPNEKRDIADFSVEAKATLAPPIPVSTAVYIGKTADGDIMAEEVTQEIPGTVNMFTGEVVSPNTAIFSSEKEAK